MGSQHNPLTTGQQRPQYGSPYPSSIPSSPMENLPSAIQNLNLGQTSIIASQQQHASEGGMHPPTSSSSPYVPRNMSSSSPVVGMPPCVPVSMQPLPASSTARPSLHGPGSMTSSSGPSPYGYGSMPPLQIPSLGPHSSVSGSMPSSIIASMGSTTSLVGRPPYVPRTIQLPLTSSIGQPPYVVRSMTPPLTSSAVPIPYPTRSMPLTTYVPGPSITSVGSPSHVPGRPIPSLLQSPSQSQSQSGSFMGPPFLVPPVVNSAPSIVEPPLPPQSASTPSASSLTINGPAQPQSIGPHYQQSTIAQGSIQLLPGIGSTTMQSRPPGQPHVISGPGMYSQRFPVITPTAINNPNVVPQGGTSVSPPIPPAWTGAPPRFSGTPHASIPQNVPGRGPPSMGQYVAPGISQPGSPAASGGSPSHIDPTQIPRSHTTSTIINFETRVNGQAVSPPSATSNFIVRDSGNCSPRYMRCTLNQIPCSGDLLASSSMPLALMVQPLALPHPLEEPIQIVDFGESGPVRCASCKAYMNPFMTFVDQGHRFKCCICGQTNDTPREYHCNLGPDNRRRDADSRPELSRGAVEFVATEEFLVRPPMFPLFFFLIDVSMNAVAIGATRAACSAVQRVLADLPNVPNVKVGIATFDNTLHFYNFTQAQQPSMLVVPDVQDVYTPLQSGLIVPVVEYREQLEQLLENIPIMFQGTPIADSALGAAIKGASLAIKSNGGKLLVFQSVLPSIGFAALTAREPDSRKGPSPSEKEQTKLFQPAEKSLKTLAIELAELQVCCDLFLTTQEYVDVASLAIVPTTTGGQVYYYYPFSAISDSAKLYNDLRWNISRPHGLEAVMRVRCSQGLQAQDYFGNFRKATATDLDLAAISCDKTVMVSFKHDEKLPDGSECCFQCALLYTTIDGQRRIRVTTLSLPSTMVLGNVFRGADLDAQVTYFMKQASVETLTTPLSLLREKMTNSCVNILYSYRKFCATASSYGQLILPEALKLLPLYTLALTKSIGFRSDVRTDDRCYWLSRISSISSSLAIPTVYPRMFSIDEHSIKDVGDGELPETLYLSSENLSSEGIFLLEAGEDAFIYAGKAVSPEALYQLFGVHTVNEIHTNQFILKEFDNDTSKKLNALVNVIRKERCSYLRFRWCRRGDPVELLFFSYLVEDKTSLGLSYVEYLVHVHRQIQSKST